jgi:tetratricopeptide (TPR) repeat protein
MQSLARRVAGAGTPLERLLRIQRELFDETKFPYDESARTTLTAREAFERRTGNCVSFTSLFLALARSIGLPARPALLERIGESEKQGDLVVVNRHIVAVWEHGGRATVFDFNRRRHDSRVGLRLLDDLGLTAVFLNNRGAEELLAGRAEHAREWLETATSVDPDFAPAHANLGVVRRALGDGPGAFEAYRVALEIEPRDASTLMNLAALYRSTGREAEAQAALRAASLRGASPWLLVMRGDLEAGVGRPRRAVRLYRKAVSEFRLDPDLHVALARGELARNRPARARRSLLRALDLVPDHPEALRMLAALTVKHEGGAPSPAPNDATRSRDRPAAPGAASRTTTRPAPSESTPQLEPGAASLPCG